MTTEVELAAQVTEERTRRQRSPRKAKENTEKTGAQENTGAEGDKPRQQTKSGNKRRQTEKTKNTDEREKQTGNYESGITERKTAEPRRTQRVRAPLVLIPDADGAVELRVSASRPRDIYAISVRHAFANQVRSVLLTALGAGIPKAIFAADELVRAGVCQTFVVEASTIEAEEQTDAALQSQGRPAHRTPRVLINLVPSPSWDPQADSRLSPKTSLSN